MIAPQRTYTKRKFRSLLLSICFHALLCLVFFYWSTVLKKNSEHFPLAAPQKGPAKVTFQRFRPPQMPLPQSPLPQKGLTPAPIAQAAPQQPQPLVVKPLVAPQHPQPLAAKPLVAPQQHQPLAVKTLVAPQLVAHQPQKKVISKKSTVQTKEKQVLKKEQTQPFSASPSFSSQAEDPQKKVSVPSRGSYEESPPKAATASDSPSLGNQEAASNARTEPSAKGSQKHRITGAALMNAFKRSFYEERGFQEQKFEEQKFEEQEQESHSKDEAYGNAPAHVTERLREWDYSSYQKKISQALIRATKMHKKYITVPVAIQERLSFKLIISKEGTLRAEPLQPLTGIEEIDRYIDQFFALVEVPPLPKRFNLNEFTAHVTIQLTLSSGGHFLQLKPLIE